MAQERNGNRAGWRASLFPFLVCIAAAGLMFLYLWLVRLPERDRYLTQQRLRTVAALSDQIRAAIEGRLDGVREAALFRAVSAKKAIATIPGLAIEPCGGDSIVPGKSIRVSPEHGYQQGTSEVRWDSAALGAAPETKSNATFHFRYDCRRPPPSPTPRHDLPGGYHDLSLRLSGEGLAVAVPTGQSTPQTTPTMSPTARAEPIEEDCRQARDQLLCARGDLGPMLEDVLRDPKLRYSDVFIANSDGDILFERGPHGIRLERLRSSAEVMPAKSSSPSDAAPRSAIADELPTIDELLRRTTATGDLRIAGTKYRLFSQPLPMVHLWTGKAETDDDAVWVVGMLVPLSDYNRDVQGISLGSLSSLPLLLILIILATPVARIFLIGARARLRANDLRVIAASLIMASGIATILVAGLVAYARIESRLDAELIGWSKHLRKAFREDVILADALLSRFVTYVNQSPPNAQIRVAITHLLDPLDITKSESCFDDSFCGTSLDLADAKTIANAYSLSGVGFRMLYATDPNETQLIKWSAKDTATPLTTSRGFERPFARRWQTDYWRWPERDEPFVFGTLRARTTGELIATVERKLAMGGSGVIVPDMPSVIDPVVPLGFGFAVIEPGGKVVFHSRSERNLVENFLAETDAAAEVSAAISTHHETSLQTNYRGSAQRMYIQPLDGTPWTLVVFREKELARALHFDVLLTCLIGFGVYLSVCCVVFLLVSLLVPRHSAWPWPSPQLSRVYRGCGYMLGAHLLAGAMGLFGVQSHPWMTVTVAALLPLSAAITTLAALVAIAPFPRIPESEKRAIWRERKRMLGVAAAIVVVAFAAAAASAFRMHEHYLGLSLLIAGIWALCVIGKRWKEAPTVVGSDPNGSTPHVRPYLCLGLGLIFVCGVMPSLALYKDAFDLGFEAIVRHGQQRLAEQLAERKLRILNDDRWPGDRRATVLKNHHDLPPAGMFWDGDLDARSCDEPVDACPDYPGCRPSSTASLVNWLSGNSCPETENPSEDVRYCDGDSCLRPVKSGQETPWWSLQARHLTGVLMASLPLWAQGECIERRDMVFARSADLRWRTCSRPQENSAFPRQCLTLTDGRLQDVDPAGSRELTVCSALKPIVWGRDPRPGEVLVGVVLAGLAALGFWQLLRRLAERAVALRPRPAPPLPSQVAPQTSRGLLLVNPMSEVAEKIREHASSEHSPGAGQRFCLLNLADGGSININLILARHGECECLVIDNLTHRMDDADFNRSKLALLERLILGAKRKVVIISRVSPISYLRERLQSKGDRKADESYVTEEEIDRWGRVLERLALIEPDVRDITALWDTIWPHSWRARLQRPWPDPAFVPPAAPGEELMLECAGTSRLVGIRHELNLAYGAAVGSGEVLIERVRRAAQAHYRALWALLTDTERLVLIHIAREGFENLDDETWRIVGRLVQHGLVRFEPGLRIMNASFREFVRLETATEEELSDLERADGVSYWDRFRDFLLPVTALAALLLSQLQPDTFTVMVGALSAAGAASATLARLLGLFGGGAGRSRDAGTA